jgi:hypothetical protein
VLDTDLIARYTAAAYVIGMRFTHGYEAVSGSKRPSVKLIVCAIQPIGVRVTVMVGDPFQP